MDRALNNTGVVNANGPPHAREAAAAFRTALQANPENVAAWSNLGNVLKAQGRWEESRQAFERLLVRVSCHSRSKASTSGPSSAPRPWMGSSFKRTPKV